MIAPGRGSRGVNMRSFYRLFGVSLVAMFSAAALAQEALAADPTSPLTLVPDFRQSNGKPASPAELFSALDADGNGLIDRAEWKTRKMAIFYMRDVNGDVQLSRDEFPGLAADIFTKADLNGDGMLSGYEFNQAPFAQFEAAARGAEAADGISLDRFRTYIEALGIP